MALCGAPPFRTRLRAGREGVDRLARVEVRTELGWETLIPVGEPDYRVDLGDEAAARGGELRPDLGQLRLEKEALDLETGEVGGTPGVAPEDLGRGYAIVSWL
jgi:hypothetical protein